MALLTLYASDATLKRSPVTLTPFGYTAFCFFPQRVHRPLGHGPHAPRRRAFGLRHPSWPQGCHHPVFTTIAPTARCVASQPRISQPPTVLPSASPSPGSLSGLSAQETPGRALHTACHAAAAAAFEPHGPLKPPHPPPPATLTPLHLPAGADVGSNASSVLVNS